MTNELKAVLFDVDGTLVDTNYLHTVAWWEAFTQAGYDVPMASIHRAIGMGAGQMLDSLLPKGRDTDAGADNKSADSPLSSVSGPRLHPLPGARQLLRACHDQGLRVVLASSADPDELKVLCAALDADEAIDAATSSGDVDASKPAPDLVQVALDQAEADPSESVFIGDAVWDVHAAQKAGVPCIGLLSGGSSRGELIEAGAAAVYEGAADLLEQCPDRLAKAIARA